MRIVIIGQGNVGQNLMAAFSRRGICPTLVNSRTLENLPTNADAYIYAIKDTALREVISRVQVEHRAVHMHTSGTMPIDVFGPDKPHSGILYPFQSFSKTHIIEDFTTVPIFIEGRTIDDVASIYSLALNLSNHVYEANQHDRERLHVAGVFANNFTNLMYREAKQLLADTHIPFAALLPLIDETARKVHSLSPEDAQTGPAQRQDQNVIEHHLSVIPNQSTREIYRILTDRIQKNN